MSLTDKVALVTGASRGIGRAILLALAEQGATVIGTATSEAGAANISKAIEEAGAKGAGMVLNVTDDATIEFVFKSITEQYAAPSILVNNAGATEDNLFMRMKDDQWANVIDINLNAVFKLCKQAIRPMIKARWGRIINISSVSGFMGNPGQVNYCAAKMGMIGLTKSLAREVSSRGITINAVAPGFIDTDMTKDIDEGHKTLLTQQIACGRLGKPEEIAAVVRFLASPEASYMTGETLHVNGGMYMA